MNEEFNPFEGDEDDEEVVETVPTVVASTATSARGNASNVDEYPEPEAQKALNGQFAQFFVSAFHKDTKDRILKSHENIKYAVDQANYLRFQQGYYVWVYGATELTWQGKEVGYQVKS